MTTETRPTPATDEEIARGVIANCGSLPHDDDCIGAMWPKIKARIEADRALILPSSCSLSHSEIRYTGERCPLCALDVRGLIECAIQYMNFSKGDKYWRTDLSEAVKKAQAALSSPSLAPSEGESK